MMGQVDRISGVTSESHDMLHIPLNVIHHYDYHIPLRNTCGKLSFAQRGPLFCDPPFKFSFIPVTSD